MNKRKEITKNFIWRFLERFGAQGVTLAVSIVLARILDPSAYGIIALVTVITTILQVLVDGGLGSALIQKKDADNLDFSSVFIFNVVVSLLLYAILFMVAPLISSFYNNETLTPIIRVLGIIIIVSGVKNIQQAYVSRNMLFKKFFFSTLGGTIGAAAVGIILAIKGFGVWALVAQYLFNNIVDTLILWITVPWRPSLHFSYKRLSGLLSFGIKVFFANIFNTLANEIRQLIIGKKYTTEDLAFYNKGSQFPQQGVLAINTSIDSVLFPVMSKVQDNPEHIKEMTRRSIKISSYIMLPMMLGLAACAETIVKIILTEKWLECVPYLRIFCIGCAFYPIHTANLNSIKALGHSDIILKLQIIKDVFSIVMIAISMWFGVYAIAISTLVSSVFSQVVNSWPNKKLIKYTYSEQIKDILPSAVISLIMCIFVYMISLLNISQIVVLFIQVISGILIYLILSYITKNDSFFYFIHILKEMKYKQAD